MSKIQPASGSEASASKAASPRVRLTAHSTSISNVLLLGYQQISDGAKLTYMVLESYDWPDENGLSKGKCWPSIESLATTRGKSYDTIARHLKELEKAGLIRIESGQEQGTPNCYWLLEPDATETASYMNRCSKKLSKAVVEAEQPREQMGIVDEPPARQKYGTTSRIIAAASPVFLPDEETEFYQESRIKEQEKEKDSNPSRGTTHTYKRPLSNNSKTSQPQSPYLSRLMDDFSRSLNDTLHAPSNRTQVNNLFRQSGLDEKAFVEVLYEAKKRTQWAALASAKTYQTGPNRAAYFFQVVRDLLAQRPKLAGSARKSG